jgi:hypothetical protein
MDIHKHFLLTFLWLLIFAAKNVLCVVVLKRPSERDPRFFSTYCIFAVVWQAALIYCSANLWGLAYSWIYWIGAYLSHIIVVAVAFSCYLKLFWPHGRMPQKFHRRAFMTMIFLLTVVVALRFAFRSENDWMTALTTSYDQLAQVWICGVFWMLSIFSDWLGIHWHSRPYGVALGFTAMYTTGLVTSSIRAHLPTTAYSGHWGLWTVEMIVELACLCLWIRYFRKPENAKVTISWHELVRLRSILLQR